MTTIRQDLIKAAKRADRALGESTGLVAGFLGTQINSDGGFRGRSGESDLYYTMFGIEGMLAVCPEFSFESTAKYLRQFEDKPEEMGLVDLACYIRCMADLSKDFSPGKACRLLEVFRTPDGGYNVDKSAEKGTAYGCFLALGAFQDAGADVPEREGIIGCLRSLRCEGGGYSNDYGTKVGSTPACAAALSVLHYLGAETGDDTIEWLLGRVRSDGGMGVMESAPVADLLSTATGLFALRLSGADISNIVEQCLDFVDILWDGKGGFFGNSFDRVSDCEYTFYGLLALGLLS